MRKKLLAGAVVLAALLASCKVVNTHTFKVTGAVQINATEARIATTSGYLSLSAAGLGEKGVGILKSLRPFQCLSVRTPEAFDMQSRSVRFTEFELKKLVEGEPECRKIKTTTRLSGQ